MNEPILTCCFIGHRTVEDEAAVTEKLREVVGKLIAAGVNVFLFGSRSRFNSLCHSVVSEFKGEHSITRVMYSCLHEVASPRYYEIDHRFEKAAKAGRGSYVERNKEMIRDSDYCVFYFDQSYKPQNGNSGTAIAYEYALRYSKTHDNPKIINVFEK